MASLKIHNIYVLCKSIDAICYFDQDGAKYNSNNIWDLHLLAFKAFLNHCIEDLQNKNGKAMINVAIYPSSR